MGLLRTRLEAGAAGVGMSDGDDARRRTSARLAAIRERFALGLEKRLEELSKQALAAAGEDKAQAAAACESLRLGLHNLSGSAPTIGFVALGRRAATLEAWVMAERGTDGRLPPSAAADLADEIAALASARD